MSFRFHSKLERRILRKVGAAVHEFGMIAAEDHVLLAVSGGKDSLSMMELLALLQARAPIPFRLTVATIAAGYPGEDPSFAAERAHALGLPFVLIRESIALAVQEKARAGTSPCVLCSRLRRGILYSKAVELGCHKVALGHHLDDLIETLLLNTFYSGKLASMAPRRLSDDGRNEIIRPLCYVPEAWLKQYASERRFITATCGTCGQPDVHRRQMKQLVTHLASEHPQVRWQVLRALANVRPKQLLDQRLLPPR